MKQTTTSKKIAKGFTLIELLVVIAIIGILAALALPALGAAKESGLASKSAANLHQLALANLSYAADHGTYAPSQDVKNRTRWHGARTGGSGKFDPRKGYLSPYLGEDGAVKRCPLLQRVIKEGSFEEGTGGYGYNAAYIGGTPDDPFTPESPMNVPHPSETLMFATTAFARSSGLQEYAYAEPFTFMQGGGGAQASVHFRAHGRAIIAWCDGHVTQEKPSKLGGENYYGGDSEKENIGWIGPSEDNGVWNPRRKQ